MVREINEQEFKEVTGTGKVLVDCFATWCGPCRMLAPIVEEVASSNKEWSFYKMDVDKNESIAREYMIMSIPTLMLFEDGKLKNKIGGFRTKEELEEILK